MKKINRKALIILSFILTIFQANAQMQGVSVHVTTPACQGTEIFFTFSSSYVGGISQYVWKFGDQTPELIITDFNKFNKLKISKIIFKNNYSKF